MKQKSVLTKGQFERELHYQRAMLVAKQMLRVGVISAEDYRQIDTNYQERFRPIFGTLCSNINLREG